MSEEHDDLVRRIDVAYEELHRIAPEIYLQVHVEAAKTAARKCTSDALLYFVLSMESTVKRKKAKRK